VQFRSAGQLLGVATLPEVDWASRRLEPAFRSMMGRAGHHRMSSRSLHRQRHIAQLGYVLLLVGSCFGWGACSWQSAWHCSMAWRNFSWLTAGGLQIR
jgi:hypothetical protein